MNPVLIGGLAAAAFVVVAAAIHYTRHRFYEQGHQYERRPPEEPPFQNRILGPCGICRGDVSNVNGFQMNQDSCHHYMHHTCAVELTRQYPNGGFSWADLCSACLEQRLAVIQQSNRLRKRRQPQCANCGRAFTDERNADIRTLECNHRVHETCWQRMQESGSSTCPTCMDDI